MNEVPRRVSLVQKVFVTAITAGITTLGYVQVRTSEDMYTWRDAERLEQGILRQLGRIESLLQSHTESMATLGRLLTTNETRCLTLAEQTSQMRRDLDKVERRVERVRRGE